MTSCSVLGKKEKKKKEKKCGILGFTPLGFTPVYFQIVMTGNIFCKIGRQMKQIMQQTNHG